MDIHLVFINNNFIFEWPKYISYKTDCQGDIKDQTTNSTHIKNNVKIIDLR